jgi:hypothetical protein
MLLAIVVFLAALAALVVVAAYYCRRYLNQQVPAVTPVAGNAASLQLPWVKILLVATPFYFSAMYWASVTYDPLFSISYISGRKVHRAVLRRPFMQLLDSRIAAVAPDLAFQDIADRRDGKIQSNILLYEDGKLLGPAHTSLYEVAVLGMGRYAHWKGNYSIFAFSSSDNTDPNTNGRTYWAERPRDY